MGFWNNVKQLFSGSPQEKANSNAESWNGPGFHFSNWANSNFWGSHNGALRTNDEIFGVISRLANTVSSLPIREYHNYKEQHDNVSDLLTSEPNPSMSSFQLINQLEVSRNTDGNGYAWIERDSSGNPIHLWPLDPGTVIVKRNIDDNSIWYEVNSDEYHFIVYNTDIIHVKHISPLTGVLGISPLDVLRNQLKFQKSVEDFSLAEMDKKDSYIIKYDRSVSPEKRKAMIRDFHNMITENGGAVLQEKGFEYDRFESHFQPGDLSTTDSITRSRVATAFNVPLSFLNESLDKGNGKSNEQIMAQFVQMTLVPIVKQYESEFNRKLLTRSQRARGFYFKFNVNGLLRGDTAARTNFYQMMIRNGIASSNDLRKLEELPPSDNKNADQLWITGDLYPLDSDIQDRRGRLTSALTQDDSSKGGESDDDTTKVSGDQTGNENQLSKHVY
ncbi:MAG: phage portal protein [Ruminococcus flavefaciens]|nr:phage portal protein [Ruminococcus flavefaciens]